MSLLEKIRVTQTFLENKGIEKPEFGLILGSGLENWLMRSKMLL